MHDPVPDEDAPPSRLRKVLRYLPIPTYVILIVLYHVFDLPRSIGWALAMCAPFVVIPGLFKEHIRKNRADIIEKLHMFGVLFLMMAILGGVLWLVTTLFAP
ncbi:MAG: hypothetical protein JNM72_11960 [Deltaproteobacteria bacterium]|nr:hypothetical protein [Deltaproteobacteria bacterium]